MDDQQFSPRLGTRTAGAEGDCPPRSRRSGLAAAAWWVLCWGFLGAPALWADSAQSSGPRTPSPGTLWRTLGYASLAAGALLLGALVLKVVDRWRKQGYVDKLTANQELAHYRRLFEAGEVSREEFDRIRSTLGGRLRQELDVPELTVVDDEPEATLPPTPPPNGSPQTRPAGPGGGPAGHPGEN